MVRTGLARLGDARPLESVEEAYDVLLEVGGQLRALVAGLRDCVSELTSPRYEHERAGEQVRGELVAYTAAIKELTSLTTGIAKLDLEGRRTRIAEAQATIIVGIFLRAAGRLGLDPDDGVVRQALEAELLAVEEAS